MGHCDRGAGRLLVRADDPSLTGHGGLVVVGDLVEKLDLIELVDAELARERRARPVKLRRRGCSPAELVVSLAECQLTGGAFFDHLEGQRVDSAGGSCARCPTFLLRRRRCRTPSGSGGFTASGSSGRWPRRASGLTARSGAIRPGR